MTPRARLTLLAAVTLAGTAQAEDTSVTSTNFTFTASPGLTAISIDDCTSRLAESVRITGTYKGSAGTSYDLRITTSSSSTVCDRSILSACPLDGTDCACLAEEDSGTTVTASSVKLSDLVEGGCSGSSDKHVYFFVQYYQAATDLVAERSEDSASFDLVIDRTRPPAPGTAPTVVAAEEALVVTPPESDSGDVERFEICAIPSAAVADTADAGVTDGTDETNESLRGAYASASARCQSFSTANRSDGYRLTGLENGVTYQVVAATLDDAGNRSANSPAETGTPADVLDFAEYYYKVCKGDAPDPDAENYAALKAQYDARTCEEGGCNTSPTSAPPLAFTLGALLMGLLRRRRNPCA